MSRMELAVPDVSVIEGKYREVMGEVEGISIGTDEDVEIAGYTLKTVKAIQKEVVSTFKPAIEQAHRAHKAIIAAQNKYLNPLNKAEKKIKVAISNFVMERERKAKEEQRKMLEEARRKAAEEAQKAAEEALDKGDLERAIALEETAGDPKGFVIPGPAAPTKPKVPGLVTREDWKYEIVDASLLPREYLMPDERRIRKVVSALKSEAKIPGVRVWKEIISYTR